MPTINCIGCGAAFDQQEDLVRHVFADDCWRATLLLEAAEGGISFKSQRGVLLGLLVSSPALSSMLTKEGEDSQKDILEMSKQEWMHPDIRSKVAGLVTSMRSISEFVDLTKPCGRRGGSREGLEARNESKNGGGNKLGGSLKATVRRPQGLLLDFRAVCRCQPSRFESWRPEGDDHLIIDLSALDLSGNTKGRLLNLNLCRLLKEHLPCPSPGCLWGKKVKSIFLQAPLPTFFWVELKGGEGIAKSKKALEVIDAIPWVLRIGAVFTSFDPSLANQQYFVKAAILKKDMTFGSIVTMAGKWRFHHEGKMTWHSSFQEVILRANSENLTLAFLMYEKASEETPKFDLDIEAFKADFDEEPQESQKSLVAPAADDIPRKSSPSKTVVYPRNKLVKQNMFEKGSKNRRDGVISSRENRTFLKGNQRSSSKPPRASGSRSRLHQQQTAPSYLKDSPSSLEQETLIYPNHVPESKGSELDHKTEPRTEAVAGPSGKEHPYNETEGDDTAELDNEYRVQSPRELITQKKADVDLGDQRKNSKSNSYFRIDQAEGSRAEEPRPPDSFRQPSNQRRNACKQNSMSSKGPRMHNLMDHCSKRQSRSPSVPVDGIARGHPSNQQESEEEAKHVKPALTDARAHHAKQEKQAHDQQRSDLDYQAEQGEQRSRDEQFKSNFRERVRQDQQRAQQEGESQDINPNAETEEQKQQPQHPDEIKEAQPFRVEKEQYLSQSESPPVDERGNERCAVCGYRSIRFHITQTICKNGCRLKDYLKDLAEEERQVAEMKRLEEQFKFKKSQESNSVKAFLPFFRGRQRDGVRFGHFKSCYQCSICKYNSITEKKCLNGCHVHLFNNYKRLCQMQEVWLEVHVFTCFQCEKAALFARTAEDTVTCLRDTKHECSFTLAKYQQADQEEEQKKAQEEAKKEAERKAAEDEDRRIAQKVHQEEADRVAQEQEGLRVARAAQELEDQRAAQEEEVKRISQQDEIASGFQLQQALANSNNTSSDAEMKDESEENPTHQIERSGNLEEVKADWSSHDQSDHINLNGLARKESVEELAKGEHDPLEVRREDYIGKTVGAVIDIDKLSVCEVCQKRSRIMDKCYNGCRWREYLASLELARKFRQDQKDLLDDLEFRKSQAGNDFENYLPLFKADPIPGKMVHEERRYQCPVCEYRSMSSQSYRCYNNCELDQLQRYFELIRKLDFKPTVRKFRCDKCEEYTLFAEVAKDVVLCLKDTNHQLSLKQAEFQTLEIKEIQRTQAEIAVLESKLLPQIQDGSVKKLEVPNSYIVHFVKQCYKCREHTFNIDSSVCFNPWCSLSADSQKTLKPEVQFMLDHKVCILCLEPTYYDLEAYDEAGGRCLVCKSRI